MPVFQVITVSNAIKVTVDGPRDSRNTSKYLNGNILNLYFIIYKTF